MQYNQFCGHICRVYFLCHLCIAGDMESTHAWMLGSKTLQAGHSTLIPPR